MKKLTTLLCLLLCLALALPCAAQESDAYIPGAIAHQLIADAWQAGKMLGGTLKLRLDADAEALGMTAEDQQTLDLICAVMDAASLSLAAGKTEGGVRVQAQAVLEHAQGGDDVAIDAAANLDLYGVSLESSLIPGKRVSAKWETLMAMAGMSDEDIAMLISLREVDWEDALEQLLTELDSFVDLAAQIAAPYMGTVIAWLDTLTVEELSDVAASDSLPAAATVYNVYLAPKDVGNLITALADTLDQDATLKAIIDAALAEADESDAVSCDELIAQMRAQAAAMTDTESPIMATLGMDESGAPLYGELYVIDESSESLYACLIAAPTQTGATCTAALMLMNADNTVADGFSLEISATPEGVSSLTQIFAEGSPILGMSHDVAFAAVTTADGQPGFSTEQTMTMNLADGSDEVQMLMNSESTFARTADGGEVSDATVSMDMYTGGQSMTVTAVSGMSLFPTGDGGYTGSFGMTESVPALGLNTVGFDVVLSTADYDPAVTAALAETALETADADAMNALLEEITGAAEFKAMEAIQALPTEVLALMME